MQTPGHAVVNLTFINAAGAAGPTFPILLGAILPDVPIMVLYVREHVIRRVPEEVVWRDHYRRPFWQNLIHAMHSFPLGAAGLALSFVWHWSFGVYFFASALLHALCDFPVHVEDAHRHFWPLSSYRFLSPISFWDLRYHAREVAAVEFACVASGCFWLWAHTSHPVSRTLLCAVIAWYAFSYVQLWRSKPVDPRARTN